MVRNLLSLSFTAALSIIIMFVLAVLPQRSAFCGGVSYRFYVGDTSADCGEIFVSPALAPVARIFVGDIGGECVVYDSLDVQEFLKEVEGEIVFCEEFSDGINYYCRADMPYRITLYGEEINLHICVGEDGVAVGTPIIFGGY